MLSGPTIPCQSGPGSNDNEGVLRIPPNPSITEASPLDCLASYTGHSLCESYPCAEAQSEYSTAPADRQREGNIYEEREGESHRRLVIVSFSPVKSSHQTWLPSNAVDCRRYKIWNVRKLYHRFWALFINLTSTINTRCLQ